MLSARVGISTLSGAKTGEGIPLSTSSAARPHLAARQRSDRPLKSGHAKSESAVTIDRNTHQKRIAAAIALDGEPRRVLGNDKVGGESA
jgi:hypothetical protein